MASGTNYTKYAAPKPAENYLGAEWEGKVRAMHDTYAFSTSSSGTTVSVGILRAGEVFLGADIFLTASLGSGTTLALGDSSEAAHFMAATASTAAGRLEANLAVGFKASVDTTIIITLGGGTATGTFGIVIYKACSN